MVYCNLSLLLLSCTIATVLQLHLSSVQAALSNDNKVLRYPSIRRRAIDEKGISTRNNFNRALAQLSRKRSEGQAPFDVISKRSDEEKLKERLTLALTSLREYLTQKKEQEELYREENDEEGAEGEDLATQAELGESKAAANHATNVKPQRQIGRRQSKPEVFVPGW